MSGSFNPPSSHPFNLPPDLIARMAGIFGSAGAEWVAGLPDLLADYARRWRLTVGRPFEPMSINYVAPAVQSDGTEVVLKLGVPNPELSTEIEALRLYDGRGAARLLEADAAAGALLLEYVRPGTMLSALPDDEQAMHIAAGLMQRLWRPLPADHIFPNLERWTAALRRLRPRYQGGTGPFPPDLVALAESLYAELSASAPPPVLLHGDLHHMNILASTREPWLVIDPKGVAGDPAFEVGPLLYNPLPESRTWPNMDRVVARRVAQLAAELGLDRRRVAGWGLVQAVLSACWDLEDSAPEWTHWITFARLFPPLLD